MTRDAEIIPPGEPTPEQIRERAAAERAKRRKKKRVPYEIPTVSVDLPRPRPTKE